ncbi:C3HC zinc finger-like-domain-containing protein [Scheffersomyces coipomensis]|uniref:C3HC zinc finger-like-domain-containing protein n=1 Tax=Scheffersomyces coipomensis TaxID=1788519 RepID=UPI00315C776A
MNMDDISSTTPKILKDCLDAFESPRFNNHIPPSPSSSYGSSSAKLDRSSFNNHPDIQYFQQVKAKNHYSYHKSKINKQNQSIDNIHSKMTVFDPYNPEFLITRLKTFNVMNWRVPELTHRPFEERINELNCARNGWKCVSFSLTNNVKNQLMCTSCSQQVILKFSDNIPISSTTGSVFSSSDYQYDIINDDLLFSAQQDELNEALHDKYWIQIKTEAHSKNCSWRNFETPLEGVYYPRPYINHSDELLIRDYLKILHNLINNSITLNEYADNISIASNEDDDVHFKQFIKVSNEWLVSRYFQDNKENLSILLDYTPSWYYKLAMLGWSLNVQSFSHDLILLLICNKCNQRVFLNSTSHNPISNVSQSPDLQLSNSKILTPCNYPITSNITHDETQFDEVEESIDPEKFNPFTEHKPWCCNIHNVTTSDPTMHTKTFQYLMEMMINSSNNIGPNGDYVIFDGNKMHLDDDSLDTTTPTKRKTNFDINEGLERLNKLRKLYLIEE